MPKRGTVAFVLAALAAVAGLVVTAASDKRDLAFTLGVLQTQVAAAIQPGHPACQGPIDVPASFGRIRFSIGTFGRPGPPLGVTVTDSATHRELARSTLAPGYPDNATDTVSLAEVSAGRSVFVCLSDRGPRPVAAYGGPSADASVARVDGKALPADIALVFLRERPASALSLVPEMFRRAALFRPPFVGAWTFWLLGALLLFGAPALLARALAGTKRD